MRMIPQHKCLFGKDMIDGFSLLLDQIRIDIDLKYLSNGTQLFDIHNHYQYATNLFEYDFSFCHKIKANINWEKKHVA